MSTFFIIASVILWSMQTAIGAWLYLAFPQIGWKIPVATLPLAMTILVRFGMEYTRTHYGTLEQVLYYVVYIWGGLVFLAFCIVAAFAILQWILQLCHVPARSWTGPLSLAVMGIVLALSLWGGFSSPRIKRIPVNVPGAPKMKIALISDAHLGMGISLARFEKALQKIEAERPDVIFLLGDIFEYGPNLKKYAERLKQANPPLGIYGVFGNHEYYMGYERSKNLFNQAGVNLLENQTAALENGVQVAGIKDARSAHVSAQAVTKLLSQTDAQKPLVFLSHTPLYAEQAAAAGADLMFSGHTHNGQIFPFKYLVRTQFPRVYGLHDVDGMKFYITSGMFYWGIPLRFLAPAEIPIIEVN